MSGPSMPADNSFAVEQSRQAAAKEERAEQERKAEARKAELAALRGTASSTGRASARDYFTEPGSLRRPGEHFLHDLARR